MFTWMAYRLRRLLFTFSVGRVLPLGLNDLNDLKGLLRTFPGYKEEFLHALFDDEDALEQVLSPYWDIARLAAMFPGHHAQLLERRLASMLKYSYWLKDLVEASPAHGEQLLKRVLDCPELLTSMLKDSWDLVRLAEAFPAHGEQLLNFVLGRPDVLARMLDDSWDILGGDSDYRACLAAAFPDYTHIFGKPSVAEALQAIEDCRAHWEMKQNARPLVQASRTAPDSLLSKMGDLHLYPKVLSFLGGGVSLLERSGS